MTDTDDRFALIVMGGCGVGKTSVGQGLARRLGAVYLEADDYHPPENVAAMARGVPLSDDMRRPWLTAMSRAAETTRQTRDVVVACSALKRQYRDLIRDHVAHSTFVHLQGDRDLIARRLQDRKDHFMPPALLDSQLETLEAPDPEEAAISVDVTGDRDTVIARAEALIRAALPHDIHPRQTTSKVERL